MNDIKTPDVQSQTIAEREAASARDDEFDVVAIVARLFDERGADIIEALNEYTPAQAAAVLLQLPLERAVEVLDTPGLDEEPEIVTALPRERAAPMLSGMSADRVAEIFRHLDETLRAELLQRVEPEMRASLKQILAYPEETAGSIMTTEFVSVPADWSVQQTLQHIRMVEGSRETVYSIYVLDPATKKLLKGIPLRRLISADPAAPVLTASTPRNPISVTAMTSSEDVARLISKYDLLAVPVVDGDGHVIGIVTVDDVIDSMIDRQTEEVQRFGGMEALDEPYMDISFFTMIKKRAGWLCVLFLSEMLTASAMQGFEGELEKAIVLTLFIPLIMSSGGNSGSQATSLLIRALALREITLGDWWRVAIREIPTGIVLGSILGLIGIARIAIWQKTGLYDYGEHWVLIALTVGVALIGIVLFGSFAGSMLPFALKRLGFDPATASAPFVATLVDVSGLVIYFTVAILILKGTLL